MVRERRTDMATNYSFKQFVNTVIDGADTETLMDLGRRYPCTLAAVSEAKGVAPEQIRKIANAVPDFITARKIEKGLQNPGSTEETDEVEAEEEAPAVEEKPAPKKRTRRAHVKKAEPEPEVEDGSEDEDDGKYAGQNAQALFKECKKRGIKAAPKKPAKYYIELLEKDDAKADSAEDEDDEDWDI